MYYSKLREPLGFECGFRRSISEKQFVLLSDHFGNADYFSLTPRKVRKCDSRRREEIAGNLGLQWCAAVALDRQNRWRWPVMYASNTEEAYSRLVSRVEASEKIEHHRGRGIGHDVRTEKRTGHAGPARNRTAED